MYGGQGGGLWREIKLSKKRCAKKFAQKPLGLRPPRFPARKRVNFKAFFDRLLFS